MFLDLHTGVLEEFSAFGRQRLTYGERAGYSQRWPLAAEGFDVEDPAALASEAARLATLEAARRAREVPWRRRRQTSPRPPARCPQCRRRVAQRLRGKPRVYCDKLCKQEYLGYRQTRCRICRAPFDLPVRGRIKLYCSPACRDSARPPRDPAPPRASRACRCCGAAVEQPRTGKAREFCDHKCRQRCYAKAAGKWPSRAKGRSAAASSPP